MEEPRRRTATPELAGDGWNCRQLGLIWGKGAGNRGVAAKGIWWRRRMKGRKSFDGGPRRRRRPVTNRNHRAANTSLEACGEENCVRVVRFSE
jgi:hypothetical protein